MKIEKLPSGSYRIRKMYKGKTYTVITDYKPTQKEAIQLLAEKLDKTPAAKSEHLTFRVASEKYIEMKSNVLSPRTIKEYTETPSRLSDSFNELLISDITQQDIQKEINTLAKTKSPKTVRNYHGFISAVISAFRPDMKISLCHKNANQSHIYPLTTMLSASLTARKALCMKFQLSWHAMDSADQRSALSQLMMLMVIQSPSIKH